MVNIVDRTINGKSKLKILENDTYSCTMLFINPQHIALEAHVVSYNVYIGILMMYYVLISIEQLDFSP